MRHHEHYDAERDTRWTCLVAPCLLGDVAPMPSLYIEAAQLPRTIERLRERMGRLTRALESIAANTCCDPCREAALVARAALDAPEPSPFRSTALTPGP